MCTWTCSSCPSFDSICDKHDRKIFRDEHDYVIQNYNRKQTIKSGGLAKFYSSRSIKNW